MSGTLVCDCDDAGLQNTGVASCVPKFGVTKKLILVPLYASDGTKNFIDLTSPIDATLINGLINQADRSKAIYPIAGDIKNIAKTKTESTKQTFDDGSIYPISPGVYGFTGIYPEMGPVFAAMLNASHCTEVGIYEVNGSGSLRGYTNNEDGKLYPSPLSKATIEAIWNDASDTVLENTVFNFQFAPSFQPEYLYIVGSSNISGINLLNINGLVDVLSTNVSSSSSTWVVKLKTRFNTPAKGLVAADFAVYNVTDSAALTVTSSVESPAGTYTIVHATTGTTAGDVLRLTPTKTGFNYSAVVANTSVVA